MRMAIDIARLGIHDGQSPFGSVVVKSDRLVAKAHNTVWRDTNPTAHAEINALRLASEALRSIDLEGCTVFTTCEPCPMCLSAIHWAHADRIVYGASIEDAAMAGFRELSVSAEKLARLGKSPLVIERCALVESCQALFEEWRAQGMARNY
jgi:tRNA(Arg) A34 adenosine deaminase TadA